jgi:hypothetical protein
VSVANASNGISRSSGPARKPNRTATQFEFEFEIDMSISFFSARPAFSRFRLQFLVVFGFDEGFQAAKVRRPEAAILLDPAIDGAQRFRIEPVNAIAALPMLLHKMRAAQQAQMLGDCRTRNRKGFGNLARGLAAPAQQVEDSTASRIGKRLEGGLSAIACRGAQICNRTVTHNA